ncbi:MAG: 2-oxo acid dehydrogenase subunit E2 [Betaproteobacteria bacterium]|nr:2-oxo acid dehydrogenase subunit E2 [Betaproteobacteria bacterium]
MQKNVVMPVLGPSIEEGLLISWHVAEGEFVKRGAPLFSVETDKSIVDCEATDDGYLSSILVPVGTNARVAQALAVLTDSPARATEDAASIASPRINAVAAEVLGPVFATMPVDQRLRSSPRARRVAQENGVPIEEVRGTGPEGRVIQRDIANYVSAAVAARGCNKNVRTGGAGATRDVALSSMRKAIARRLTESSQSIPSFVVTIKIVADAMLSTRTQINGLPDRKVSINDIVVRACALALRACPQLNATFEGETTRLHDDIDIGVAIALDDGLVAPIVRRADTLSLIDIADTIGKLSALARAGTLQPVDYQGGTFTLSNLGMHGVESFSAIINPPQCAILAVGMIDRELYRDGASTRERNAMRVTLTADHRVIDGVLAARFLNALKSLIENPARLLI